MEHGTRYAWVKGGCRCDECGEARLLADRARRQARKDRAKADPSTIPHGPWGYADYGCRCEVCSENHRQQNRDRLGQQPRKTWTEEEIQRAVTVYATEGFTAAGNLGIAHAATVAKWAADRGVACYEPPIVHGQARYQRYGCRCAVCTAGYRAAMRAAKEWRFAHSDQAPHGTQSGYTNWGCRCDDCKEAGSLGNYRTKIRRKAGLTAGTRVDPTVPR